MNLDVLADSLIEESKKEANELIDSAKEDAEKIISNAKSIEEGKLNQAEKEVKDKLTAKKRERIAWANLEKKRIIAEAKEEAVSNILESVFLGLSKLRKSSKYSKFMKNILSKALKEMNESFVIIHIVKGDKRFLGSLRSVKSKIVEDLKYSGGILIENRSKTVSINYSLEAIYEMKKNKLRKEIYDSLFGG